MRSRCKCVWMVLAFLALVPVALVAQAGGQGILFGEWKLIVAKSNFGGGPKLMGMTMKVTSDTPALIEYSVNQNTESGFAVSYSFKGAADGKEYPLTGAASLYSYTEDPGVVHETEKDPDGTITKGDFSVSANGKVGTWVYTVTNPDGSVLHTKLIFEHVV